MFALSLSLSLQALLQTHISQLLHRCKLTAKISWCGWRERLLTRTITHLTTHLEALQHDMMLITQMIQQLNGVKTEWEHVHDKELIAMRKQIQETW